MVKKNSEQQSNSEFDHETISVARVECRGLLKLDPDYERIKPALKPEEAATATITLSRNGLKKVLCPFLMKAIADERSFDICTVDSNATGVSPKCAHIAKSIYFNSDVREYSSALKKQEEKRVEKECEQQRFEQKLKRAESISKPNLSDQEFEEAKKICETPLTHFLFTTRIINVLAKNNLHQLWQIVVLDKSDLRKMRGIGLGTLMRIEVELGGDGFLLGTKLNPELEAELQKAK